MIKKKNKKSESGDNDIQIDENGDVVVIDEGYVTPYSPQASKKKKRKRRKDMTPEEKKKRTKRDLLITFSVFAVLGLLIGIFALSGYLGAQTNKKLISSFDAVNTAAENTVAINPDTGYYTFTSDDEFKVMQLTDVHIGAGAFSIKKDSWALNACATLIQNERPDLVIVTGDIAYPVPFQAGTFNNMREAELFATLMERLQVYWVPVFGNHDTEAYSMYDRAEISEFYSEEKWTYCLYRDNAGSIDGHGNSIINVCNSDGLISQSLVLLDSHSYVNGDITGIKWMYDNIHQNQIDWYEDEVTRLNDLNITAYNALSSEKQSAYATAAGFTDSADFSANSMIKSCAFFHIPLTEYLDAWDEYVDNGYNDTANVHYVFGVAGETGKVVYSGIGQDELFETMIKLGSTQAVFCGHDHLNNFSVDYTHTATVDGVEYTGTIRLTYGMSIDYLAYSGIYKKTEQRGCTTIDISTNGSVEIAQHRLSNY